MAEYETSWKSGGQTYTVKVTQRSGEDIRDTAERFVQAETALKVAKPPDPPAGP